MRSFVHGMSTKRLSYTHEKKKTITWERLEMGGSRNGGERGVESPRVTVH